MCGSAAGNSQAVAHRCCVDGCADRNLCAAPDRYTCADEHALMAEFDFSIASGSRAETALSRIGHIAWNPWRPAASDEPGQELEEDLSASFISLDHLAQVGIPGGTHGQDLTVPQMQRRFLQLYVEWLSRERRGAEA